MAVNIGYRFKNPMIQDVSGSRIGLCLVEEFRLGRYK